MQRLPQAKSPPILLFQEYHINNWFLGYFTTGHRMTTEELEAVQGRTWEEWVFYSLVDILDQQY
jgi:hypothetical protein